MGFGTCLFIAFIIAPDKTVEFMMGIAVFSLTVTALICFAIVIRKLRWKFGMIVLSTGSTVAWLVSGDQYLVTGPIVTTALWMATFALTVDPRTVPIVAFFFRINMTYDPLSRIMYPIEWENDRRTKTARRNMFYIALFIAVAIAILRASGQLSVWNVPLLMDMGCRDFGVRGFFKLVVNDTISNLAGHFFSH